MQNYHSCCHIILYWNLLWLYCVYCISISPTTILRSGKCPHCSKVWLVLSAYGMYINWVREGGIFPRVRTGSWWSQLGLCGQFWRWSVETRLGSELNGPANLDTWWESDRLAPGSRGPFALGISQFLYHAFRCLIYLVGCLHSSID